MPKHWKQFFIFALILISVSSAVSDDTTLEPTSFSLPVPGTKVQWKNITTGFTYTYTVRKPDDGEEYAYTYFTETGDKRHAYLFCGYCGVGDNTIDLDAYAKLFPLDVGNKTTVKRGKTTSDIRTWQHRIRVVDTELIEVPFQDEPLATFVIKEDVRSGPGQSKGYWTTTFWYAPSLANNVRIIGNLNDQNEKRTSEVVQYVRP